MQGTPVPHRPGDHVTAVERSPTCEHGLRRARRAARRGRPFVHATGGAGRAADPRQARRRGDRAGRRHDRRVRRRRVRGVDGAGPGARRCSTPGEPLLLRITPDEPDEHRRSRRRRCTRAQPVPVRRHAGDLPRAGRCPPPLVAVARRQPRSPGHCWRARPAAGLRVRAVGRRRRAPADGAAAVVVASHGRDEETVLARRAAAPACPTSGWWPAARRGAAVLGALDVCDDAARPRCTPRPGSTSAPARPRRWRCRSWPRSSPSAATAPHRPVPPDVAPHRRAAPRDRHRPGVRHERSPPSRRPCTSTTTGAGTGSAAPAACGVRRRPGRLPAVVTQPTSPALVPDVDALRGRLDASATWPTTAWRPRCSAPSRLPPADPARGRGRGRQDRGRQGAGRRARHPADPAAVLRGHRRRRGALRVELPPPAARHPARRGARATTLDDDDLFGRDYLVARPLLQAVEHPARGRPCC